MKKKTKKTKEQKKKTKNKKTKTKNKTKQMGKWSSQFKQITYNDLNLYL